MKRLKARHKARPSGHAAAVGRSLDIYYRDTARNKRMDRLNAHFLPKGGLAFDLGAHVGDRTASFLRLGARVVALEPQPHVFRALRLIHGRNSRAILKCQAVGAHSEHLEMRINSSNPTVSTLSPNLVEAAHNAPGWDDQVWDTSTTVEVTTLDRLIQEYGLPDFIKIDIEGYELEALKGLSQTVSALSFEFTTLQRTVANNGLSRLMDLGDYEFNFSLGEEHRFDCPNWLSEKGMKDYLKKLPDTANSGDVYARLK
ncbi:MAG: FkbM family methyltransferase [Pseudomonadota bacterium]